MPQDDDAVKMQILIDDLSVLAFHEKKILHSYVYLLILNVTHVLSLSTFFGLFSSGLQS